MLSRFFHKIIKFVSVVALLASAAMLLYISWDMVRVCSEKCDEVADTIKVTVYDTVKVKVPVARDSVVVRYVNAKFKVSKKEGEISEFRDDEISKDGENGMNGMNGSDGKNGKDSVEVLVPITQKTYETEDYKAWVSGYEPNLDSLELYRPTIIKTMTVRKQPRWGIGVAIGAGYGVINKKPDVFVGVAGYYRLWPNKKRR